jgi:adenine-specific DNA-methyltransferase
MSIEILRPSFTLTEDRLKEFAAVVPEAFADGKINWDTLREVLGEHLEDESQEHFGLFWPGKRDARRLAALPSKGTLVPQPGQGVNEDNTHNLFIEGDNLEVLKLLQKSYAGRVKLIFIDPPFNTGHDFVYPDNYSEPLQAYLGKSGLLNDQGQVLSTNTKASGRYHSNWLSMIYPRLLLSRNLLMDDGSIFVVIDDNEYNTLRGILNEIFGEENFLGSIIWQHSVQGKNDVKGISVHHNYLLAYSKTTEFIPSLMPRTEEHNKAYSNPDNDSNGPWRAGDYRSPHYRENLRFDIITPSGKKILPPKFGWRWSKEEVQKKIESKEIIFLDNETKILRKIYLNDQEGRVTESIWFGKDVGTTRQAAQELKDLFNGVAPFDTPKPVSLLYKIFKLSGLTDGDIVLDYFAGSCSTAHAILQYQLNNIKLKFLMVQLPEPTPSGSVARELGYKTISSIGIERIKRVIKVVNKNEKGKNKLFDGLDFGFKCFKLNISNYAEWQDISGKDTTQLELSFEKAKTPLIDGWKPENLLIEILLMQGFPLDCRIRNLSEFKKNDFKEISSEFCQHRLYICLDIKIHIDTIAALHLHPEDIVVCLDNALSDEAKITLADQCNLKVI